MQFENEPPERHGLPARRPKLIEVEPTKRPVVCRIQGATSLLTSPLCDHVPGPSDERLESGDGILGRVGRRENSAY